MAGGILDDLAEIFEMEEASSNVVGSIAGSTLTETGGAIASATGKVGNCRDFETSDSRYFTIADNALFSLSTDTSFMLCAWVNLESTGAASNPIVGHYSSTGNDRDYLLQHEKTANRFSIILSSNGTTATTRQATSFGAPSLATWYFVCGWHDAAADTLNIQVNNGTVDSVAHSTGTRNGGSAFRIGAVDFGSLQYYDGLIDQVLFYKDGFPDAAGRSLLYNGGNGLSYAQMQRPIAKPKNVQQSVHRASYY